MASVHHPGALIGGRFELVRPLGAGGMGSVWETIDRTSGHAVALKILHPQLTESPEAVRRLEREAMLLIALRHPNIAACIAPSVGDETFAIAMALVDGRRLDDVMGERARNKTPWSLLEVRAIFEKLCGAVVHAHGRGVLHRDLKPQNLMLVDDPEVRVVVLDFGVAKVLATASSDATTQGRRLGSLNYAAPEQMRGEPVDQRADVFALGVILFEMLTLERAWIVTDEGRRAPAFDGRRWPIGVNELMTVLDRMTNGERPLPSRVRPDLPEALDEVVERATAADPDDRYHDVELLLTAFLEATSETVVLPAPDVAPTVARAPSVEPTIASTVLHTRIEEPSPTRVEPRGSPRRSLLPWVLAGLVGASVASAIVLRSTPEVLPVEVVAPDEVEARPRVVVEAKPAPAPPTVADEAPLKTAAPPRDRRRRREKVIEPEPTPEAIEVLRDRILSRAKKIEDAQQRRTIERIATTSAMAGDRAGLKLALERLEKSEREQERAP